jgi:putative nucleotidyltransferase with HDIG domain
MKRRFTGIISDRRGWHRGENDVIERLRDLFKVIRKQKKGESAHTLQDAEAPLRQLQALWNIDIAIDNPQHVNVDLAMAHDHTLEGWAKALDLRDEHTRSHTTRVVELTLQLARAMGIPDADLVHLLRGALLHDVGKIGIPDSILLKPGPLSDEEWVVMKKHPTYAYELLSSILYLRPALDIPYCHHEKWDGTGYPRGMKGEQIRLGARICAVANVWDSLRSHVPWRSAWSRDQALDYIRKQAGKDFDPAVVDAFLPLVEHSA